MKAVRLLWIALAAAMLPACRPAAAASYALLVGIGEYAGRPSWRLKAPPNDLALMYDLCKEWGIPVANTYVLQNAAATRDAVVAKLRGVAAKAKQGDRVLFYFTGHAVEIADVKNPDEPDANDEALVLAIRSGATQPDLLLDDDLNQLLIGIRARGATVACLLDCCFSYDGIKAPGGKVKVGAMKTIHDKLGPRGPMKPGIPSGRIAGARSNALLLSAGSASQTVGEGYWRLGRDELPISPLALSVWALAPQSQNWKDLANRVVAFHRGRFGWQPALQGESQTWWQRPAGAGYSELYLNTTKGKQLRLTPTQLLSMAK